uniref:Uncharacterized protein TCIL3000_11_2760 n=1 Tax=Trypanosoma congolense (strain IL3000) TaxID=1068625 RepID=G0UZR3_TRYCI|nr:unnamed protein product [Trypanosoma congolense IL3000]
MLTTLTGVPTRKMIRGLRKTASRTHGRSGSSATRRENCFTSAPSFSSTFRPSAATTTSLCLNAGLEVVPNSAVNNLQVAAASSARASAFNGLHRPVETPALGTRVGASGTPFPLHVVGVTTTAAAQNVRAPVALPHRRCTLRHFVFFLPEVNSTAKACGG